MSLPAYVADGQLSSKLGISTKYEIENRKMKQLLVINRIYDN